MNTPSSQNQPVANAHHTGGTPEETSITVKWVNGKWAVENNLGEVVDHTDDRETAISLARKVAAEQGASGISVQRKDGSVESTIDA